MAYCIDFFRKWKNEGNFCGLDESQVSRLNFYMDTLEMLVKQKIPEEKVIELFTVGAATPLITAPAAARTEGLNFVAKQLRDGKKVRAKDLQQLLILEEKKERPAVKQDPAKTLSPQPGSIKTFTGLQGVTPSTRACEDAKCPSIASRGSRMAKECTLSGLVPGNTGTCPLDLQFYYVKYPVTAACRAKHCDKLKLQRPGLHLCTFTGMRPENHTHQVCPLTPKEDRPEGWDPTVPAQTQEQPAAAAGPEPGIIPAPKPNPCRDFHPAQGKKQQFVCPDLDNHLVVEEVRGRCCDILNIPINQLPGNECPLERTQRLKGTAPESPKPVWKCGAPCPDGKDHTAGDKCKILGIASKQIPQHQCPIICDPFTSGKIIKGPPYKITKSKLLDSERDAMVDALLERTQFTPKDIEQIDELVKINREGWSCRYDVIEAAVMMLLAKAEGE